jgi:2-hydroxychromene-2-carboxylate isomerase
MNSDGTKPQTTTRRAAGQSVASNSVDYYFSVASPWSYLGSARFINLARQYALTVNVLPMDLSRVFAASGGLLYGQRAPQRRAYRQIELARWRTYLGIHLQLEPAFYPVDRRPASCLLIAARQYMAQQTESQPLLLSHAILRAIWVDDLNIADWSVLKQLADEAGYDGKFLINAAQSAAILAQYEHDTDRAIAAQIFGAPSYVIDGEIFWGQDRLDFVERKIVDTMRLSDRP